MMVEEWWRWFLDNSPALYWLLGICAVTGIELFGSALLPKAAVDEVSLWGKVRSNNQQFNVPKRSKLSLLLSVRR